jgi:hypothetical protein
LGLDLGLVDVEGSLLLRLLLDDVDESAKRCRAARNDRYLYSGYAPMLSSSHP